MSEEQTYFRKVLHWPVTVSPNIRLALEQLKAGQEPTNERVWPGVMTWEDYCFRLATYKEDEVCIKLRAKFWKGRDVLLFPSDWLKRAEEIAAQRRFGAWVAPTYMGVDPAEGGDKTTFCVGDRIGVVRLDSMKTPDTNKVVLHAVGLMSQYGISSGNVCFDRGMGQAHVDRMRAMGYKEVRSVAFGSAMVVEPKRGMVQFETRREAIEQRGEYKNRVAQMYGEASELLSPNNAAGYGVPREFVELHQQLAVIPRWTDEYGKLYLPPKHAKPDAKDDNKVTLVKLVGHSPDEADAFVLMLHAMLHKPAQTRATVLT